MNIAFDATHHFGFSGINVYMRNLVGSLARFFPDDCYTMLTTYNKIERLRSEFPEADRVLLNADNPFPNSLALGSLGRPIMDRFYGRIYEKQSHKYDIIHFTNPYHFESIRNAVVTLHDMMPYYPGMGFNRSQRRNFRKKIRAIERSNAYIFVPSEYVRTELLSHYDFTPERMCVTHEAAGSDFVPIPSGSNDLSAFGLKAEDEFFLYVGRIDARKNIERLVQAYLDLDSDITERIKLVLIAKRPRSAPGAISGTISTPQEYHSSFLCSELRSCPIAQSRSGAGVRLIERRLRYTHLGSDAMRMPGAYVEC